ncbi:MAG: hypothetical protein CL666_01585 [Balneola sp.]|nr:hypothetical protein [Balneola sp.]|tara:strand:- start:69973 stop:70236 length:264 start_codon:yes stop_codon:yes gene_type:complete
MTLIPKISRLKKLPELLKQKREAEEHASKEKQHQQEKRKDRKPFEIDDEVTLNPATLKNMKIHHPPTPHRRAKSEDDNIGNNVDLTV